MKSNAKIAAALLVLAVLAVDASGAVASSSRACAPVANPHRGTKYDGANLRRIRASGVLCRTARIVARGAHRRALGLGVPASGIRRFS